MDYTNKADSEMFKPNKKILVSGIEEINIMEKENTFTKASL
jgi:hypothetical protein